MSNKFLGMDGPFYRFMSRLFDMLKLNVLWLLCSGVAVKFIVEYAMIMTGFAAYSYLSLLPLVMVGPSTVAVFSVTLRMVDDQEGYILKPFLDAMKENMKKGMILGIVLLVALYAIWIDFQFYNAAEKIGQNSTLYLVTGVILVFMTFMHMIYAFALQARYENTVINIMRNSFTIAIRYFGKTIFMFIVTAVVVGMFLWNTTTQFLGILIGPATMMLTISGFAMQVFRRIESDNEAREEESN